MINDRIIEIYILKLELELVSQTRRKREMENSMLEFSENQKPNSRLACQIQISEEHQGLTVEIPEAQY